MKICGGVIGGGSGSNGEVRCQKMDPSFALHEMREFGMAAWSEKVVH